LRVSSRVRRSRRRLPGQGDSPGEDRNLRYTLADHTHTHVDILPALAVIDDVKMCAPQVCCCSEPPNRRRRRRRRRSPVGTCCRILHASRRAVITRSLLNVRSRQATTKTLSIIADLPDVRMLVRIISNHTHTV